MSRRAFILLNVVMANEDWISNLPMPYKPTQKPSRFCFSFDVLIYLFGACSADKCRCANECETRLQTTHTDGNDAYI